MSADPNYDFRPDEPQSLPGVEDATVSEMRQRQAEKFTLGLLQNAVKCAPLSDTEMTILKRKPGEDIPLHLGTMLVLHCATEEAIEPVASEESSDIDVQLSVLEIALRKTGLSKEQREAQKAQIAPLKERQNEIAPMVERYIGVKDVIQAYAQRFDQTYSEQGRTNVSAVGELFDKTDYDHPILERLAALRRNTKIDRIIRSATEAERPIRLMLLDIFGPLESSE